MTVTLPTQGGGGGGGGGGVVILITETNPASFRAWFGPKGLGPYRVKEFVDRNLGRADGPHRPI